MAVKGGRLVRIKLNNIFIQSVLFLALAIGPAGCSTISYKVPIGNYNEANFLVIENTKTIIKKANQVERMIYVDRQVRGHSNIDISEIRRLELYSGDQLAARIRALDIMHAYGNLLLQIVNSDSPQNIADSSGMVSRDVANLLALTSKLNDERDTIFKTAAAPVADIVSQVVALGMSLKISDALNKAVETGYRPMDRLITLLGDEAYGCYKRKKAQLQQELITTLKNYNSELQKGDSLKEEALRRWADQIRTSLDNLEASDEANPKLMFDAAARSQVALLAYARSKKTQKNSDDFSKAMADYLSIVRQVASSIKNLNQY